METQQSLPTCICKRVDPFDLDGDLNKPPWSGLESIRLRPAEGGDAALQPTDLRLCWSETHLYAAFHCVDRHPYSSYTRRDDNLYDADVVELFLSCGGDISRYFEFEVNPHNAVFDATVINRSHTGSDKVVDRGWDCAGLESAVRMLPPGAGSGEGGWDVEIAAPFAGLGVPAPIKGTVWRANFYRIDYDGPVQFSAWSPTLVSPANYHRPERFGYLTFREE